MRAIYRCMLWLYPEACRAEFAEEMLAVVSARAEDAGTGRDADADEVPRAGSCWTFRWRHR